MTTRRDCLSLAAAAVALPAALGLPAAPGAAERQLARWNVSVCCGRPSARSAARSCARPMSSGPATTPIASPIGSIGLPAAELEARALAMLRSCGPAAPFAFRLPRPARGAVQRRTAPRFRTRQRAVPGVARSRPRDNPGAPRNAGWPQHGSGCRGPGPARPDVRRRPAVRPSAVPRRHPDRDGAAAAAASSGARHHRDRR